MDIKPLSPGRGDGRGDDDPAAQRDQLMKLSTSIGFMPADVAAERLARVKKAGVEKIGFAWAGDVEAAGSTTTAVQGPTFLIEYDNTQNDGNHIHSVWRDFNGDFGRDPPARALEERRSLTPLGAGMQVHEMQECQECRNASGTRMRHPRLKNLLSA